MGGQGSSRTFICGDIAEGPVFLLKQHVLAYIDDRLRRVKIIACEGRTVRVQVICRCPTLHLQACDCERTDEVVWVDLGHCRSLPGLERQTDDAEDPFAFRKQQLVWASLGGEKLQCRVMGQHRRPEGCEYRVVCGGCGAFETVSEEDLELVAAAG